MNKRNQTSENQENSSNWHRIEGGCHCRAVRFVVTFVDGHSVQSCNCSCCAMTGYIHLIVPQHQFDLQSGEKFLTEYTFNTKTAKHLFCKRCGVKSFYIPRSNPDGISVNVRCLDQDVSPHVNLEQFDGQHWEANAHTLSHLT